MKSWQHSLLTMVVAVGVVAPAVSDTVSADMAHESGAQAAVRWGVPADFNRERPESLKPAWTKRLTGYIAARDGTPLRFSVLLPAGKGPFPVIVNYSGYDPGAIGGFSYLHDNSAMSTSLDRSLLDHGYAVLGVNARGTGCSEGTFDFLGPSYGADGADIVEWAARQSWSSGSIGMANWSWAGMSQVATASARPLHLKAIAPGMALTDPRLDSWTIGGVPSQGFLTGWWMFLHSRWLAVRGSAAAEHDERCLRQVESNFSAGEMPSINLPSQLVRHPLRDEWIDKRTILNEAGNIEVPVLSMESFQDEATTARAGYYQERLNPSRLWYVQTNGNHDLYESLQFRPVLLDFFDHFVKGIANGFESRPHVEVWQETSSTPGAIGHAKDEQAKPGWVIHGAQYPMPVEVRALELSDSHALVFAPSSDEKPVSATSDLHSTSDSYEYPVPGPTVDTEYGVSSWGPLPPNWRKGSIAYSSAPLNGNLVIYGPVSADLWMASTQSDTDVQVTLTEVRPDGQERFVQRGWLRMSSRALDPERSTVTRPWPCDRPSCIQTLAPGVPALGRVELTKVSYAFRTGSRIRVWIDTPSAMGENSFDHSSLPSVNSVWHDAEHVSRIIFGTLPDTQVPPAAVDCGRVLMQPCRPDPLGSGS